eukprot:TRINITY_DN1503_c0_g1_i1.p1 TRINITY_DN1503_c0_g1~~TRINITY_DN1503_c0_g1_i1.p1  ORF type:complete len:387 (+),score=153.52 TRINITY_DN1503_c0_g1_i1:312-1472(+)
MSEHIVPYVIPLSATKPKQLTLLPAEPNSRYKTKQLQIQVTGKSKMMKTFLVNILDVAKDMQVPPPYIGTFMGYEIGAQAKWDPKKPERQQAFITGEHSSQDLSKIALQFINEVVSCPSCNLPEIVIEIDSGKVMGRCRACGKFSELKISNEKFKRYILNHPPNKSDAFAAPTKIDKKAAAINKQAQKQEKTEQEARKVTAPKKFPKEEEEIVWYSDTSEEAARARREQMLPDSFIKPKKVPEIADIKASLGSVDKLVELKNNGNITDAEYVPALFEAIVPADADSLADLIKNKLVISKFASDQDSQVALLSALEKYCGETNTSLLPKVSPLIKQLYDEEMIEEESIFAWDADNTNANAKVRENAAPIVNWLKDAEEESEGEEEDD